MNTLKLSVYGSTDRSNLWTFFHQIGSPGWTVSRTDSHPATFESLADVMASPAIPRGVRHALSDLLISAELVRGHTLAD